MNNTMICNSKNIYDRLMDDKSKMIFEERLLYSFTDDTRHAYNFISSLSESRILLDVIDSNESLYLFGAGIWGKELVKIWPKRWTAFFDNNRDNWGKRVLDLPVESPQIIKQSDFTGIVVISTRLYWREIYSQLYGYGLDDSRIINVGKIQDDLAERQYFDLEELPREDNDTFADIGSLDGMSAIRFINWSKGNFSKVYCFEPDSMNISKCNDNLSRWIDQDKVEVVNKGAWSDNTVLSFESLGNGGSSLVIQSGENHETVEVIKLDDYFKDKNVSFIKMDIEGAEIEALKGAKKTISEKKPKLAICVYHKPEDILDIPSLILSYNKDYKFYLRHYSVTAAETVLYAI